MIFQILRDGKVMFWTEHEKYIPSDDELKQMKKSGYKFKYIKETFDKSKNKK